MVTKEDFFLEEYHESSNAFATDGLGMRVRKYDSPRGTEAEDENLHLISLSYRPDGHSIWTDTST